jgi:hypothetical protein
VPAAGHRAAPWRGLTCARGRGLRCQSCLCPASVPQSRVRCAVCAPAAAAAHGSRWCRAAGWARASGGGAWEREGGAARVLRGAPPRCCSGSLRDASVLLLLLRARVPCQAWSHATGAWAAVAPLPVPRACAAAVCSGERRRHPLRALVRAPLLVCAHRPPLRCAGGHVYVIGGTGAEGTAVAAVHAYDAATDSWTSVASLPTPRSGHAAATLPGACARAQLLLPSGVLAGCLTWCGVVWPTDERIVVAGGHDAGGVGTVSVHVFHPDRNEWTRLADLPVALPEGAIGARCVRVYVRDMSARASAVLVALSTCFG